MSQFKISFTQGSIKRSIGAPTKKGFPFRSKTRANQIAKKMKKNTRLKNVRVVKV